MFTKATFSIVALATALVAAQPVTIANAEPLVLSEAARDRLVTESLGPEILVPNPVSCKGAKKLVKNAGYKKVKKIECNGTIYTFKAKKNGAKLVVTVNKYSKAISEI